MHRRLLFIILLIISLCFQLSAQEEKTARDSLKTERDSLRAETDSLNIERDSLNYSAIEVYSKKSKFTIFIHQAFFKSVIPKPRRPSKEKIKGKAKLVRIPEGKIVREILISTLDPFGYDLRDTTRYPKVFLMKAGNDLHIKLLPGIIKNLLMFKRNTPYDSILVNESIRLIRSQKYVRDVYLYSVPVTPKSDSVDVYIRVSDVWSIVPAFSMSGSSSHIGLTDVNFAGIGITSRKYIKDQYIYNYGKNEDFSVGRSAGLTLGLDAHQTNRFYLGLYFLLGNYYRFGFLSTHLEYWTYIGSSGIQQGVETAG